MRRVSGIGKPAERRLLPRPARMNQALLLAALPGVAQEPGREQDRRHGVVGQQAVGQRRGQGDRVQALRLPPFDRPEPIVGAAGQGQQPAQDGVEPTGVGAAPEAGGPQQVQAATDLTEELEELPPRLAGGPGQRLADRAVDDGLGVLSGCDLEGHGGAHGGLRVPSGRTGHAATSGSRSVRHLDGHGASGAEQGGVGGCLDEASADVHDRDLPEDQWASTV